MALKENEKLQKNYDATVNNQVYLWKKNIMGNVLQQCDIIIQYTKPEYEIHCLENSLASTSMTTK